MTSRRRKLILSALPMLLPVHLLFPGAALAHAPDPTLSGALYAQNQDLRYRWRTGQEPPAFMQAPINAGAADAGASRASKAPTFSFDPAGTSWINYGLDVACGVNGLACFSRVNAPNSFTMSFREQGHVFEWGTLKWCQFYANPPDGCYDVENIALDEFGHVQILGHHVNRADSSDYLDAVVQTYARTKPRSGWDVHALGRCDVASLQVKYELLTPATRVSTCLDIPTTLGVAASATWLPYGGNVTFTATLGVADVSAAGAMRTDPLSGRSVILQRRVVGGSTWTNVATMPAAATPGTYVYTATSQTATYEWRASFAKPPTEGVRGAASAVVKVTVSSCRTGPCPQRSGPGTRR